MCRDDGATIKCIAELRIGSRLLNLSSTAGTLNFQSVVGGMPFYSTIFQLKNN